MRNVSFIVIKLTLIDLHDHHLWVDDTVPRWGSWAEPLWWGSRGELLWWGSIAESLWWGSRVEPRWWGSRAESWWWGSRAESWWWGSSREPWLFQWEITSLIRGTWSDPDFSLYLDDMKQPTPTRGSLIQRKLEDRRQKLEANQNVSWRCQYQLMKITFLAKRECWNIIATEAIL